MTYLFKRMSSNLLIGVYMAKEITKLPKGATIIKCVCIKCQPTITKQTGHNHYKPLAGANFECEWCENTIKKFEKYAQFYREKK